MTDTPRHRRGRPKGSGIDDGTLLERIADLLVEGRARNVAAAVRHIAGHDPSLIRRLQRKFRLDCAALLSAARTRAEQVALREGFRQNQILRTTRPLSWRHAHDTSTQILTALTREREEALKRMFARR